MWIPAFDVIVVVDVDLEHEGVVSPLDDQSYRLDGKAAQVIVENPVENLVAHYVRTHRTLVVGVNVAQMYDSETFSCRSDSDTEQKRAGPS
ncbi:hypothetical protein SAMN05192544_104075 [Paraburkholderia hospita]|nr:hypothetical protein SAMN05192544_104075 [Paraburkholderia hospita]